MVDSQLSGICSVGYFSIVAYFVVRFIFLSCSQYFCLVNYSLLEEIIFCSIQNDTVDNVVTGDNSNISVLKNFYSLTILTETVAK